MSTRIERSGELERPFGVGTTPPRRIILDAAIDANAKIQATLLSEASPIIAGAIKEATEGRAGTL